MKRVARVRWLIGFEMGMCRDLERVCPSGAHGSYAKEGRIEMLRAIEMAARSLRRMLLLRVVLPVVSARPCDCS
jgi:hypothetical protein